MIYDDLFTFLNNQLPEVGSRIYTLHLQPDPAFPCVVMRQSGSEHDYQIGAKEGTAHLSIEFDIHTPDLTQLSAIATKLKTLFQGKKLLQVGNQMVIWSRLDSEEDDAYYLEKEDLWLLVRSATYTLKIDE